MSVGVRAFLMNVIAERDRRNLVWFLGYDLRMQSSGAHQTVVAYLLEMSVSPAPTTTALKRLVCVSVHAVM
jgi:hypothetical protein